MKKISIKNIKNGEAASGKTKMFFDAGSADEQRLRNRVKRAVKNVAVPPGLESKVLDLLRKQL